MDRIHHIRLLALLLLPGLAGLPACAPRITVQFQPRTGDTRSFRTSTTYDVAAVVSGHNVDKSYSTTTEFTARCETASAPGTASVTVSFDAADFGGLNWVTGLMGGYADQEKSVSGADLGLLGRGFAMEVSPQGTVTKLEGMADIVKKASDKTMNDITSAMQKMPGAMDIDGMAQSLRPFIEGQLTQALGDNAMRETMEDLITMYPPSPAPAGRSWTKKVVRRNGMTPMDRTEIWKITGCKDGLIKFTAQFSAAPSSDAPPLSLGMMGNVHAAYTGDGTATAVIDQATGWLVKYDSAMTLSGTITLADAPTGPIPQMGPVKVNVTVTSSVESVQK